MENQARTFSGINVIAGLWLIIAPFVLGYSSSGNIWQEVVFGAIITVLGLARLWATETSWPSWVNGLIGLWMIIAPWTISGTTAAARWNEVVLGIIVAVLGYLSAATTQQLQHHA